MKRTRHAEQPSLAFAAHTRGVTPSGSVSDSGSESGSVSGSDSGSGSESGSVSGSDSGSVSDSASDPASAAVLSHLSFLDWPALEHALDTDGCAIAPSLLPPSLCRALASLYPTSDADPTFRSRVVMARHGFGRGEYRYFSYPLPPLLAALRPALYARLAPLANRWNERMGLAVRFPDDHAAFLARCHAAGQLRPTPLLLQYAAGDYNCLHQDLYGEHVFPLQVAVLLSAPGRDFTGGEFVLTEQRPRMQSRPMVLPLAQGDAAIFAVHHRPVLKADGHSYRVQLRHGVSRLHAGHRHTLGLIFHDAK